MDVASGRDFLAGEADDLAVLADGFAPGDGADSDLVTEADAAIRGEDGAVELVILTWQEGPGGDGDVVFRAQVDGDSGERCGWHEADSAIEKGTRSR